MKILRYSVIVATLAAAVCAGLHVTALEPSISSSSGTDNSTFRHLLDDNFSLYYVAEESGLPMRTHYSQNEPPLLNGHTVTPEYPAPGEEINIQAEIRNDPLETGSETMEAWLYYSKDEKESWIRIEMDEEERGRLWSATIPAFEEPGTLYYFFGAMDDAENFFFQLPIEDISWATGRHHDYLSVFEDDNKVYTLVPDDLDILSGSVGYDGDTIYFHMEVEGEISGGTITPFEPYLYSVGFYVPDVDLEMGPKPRYVLEHAQHAQFMTFPVVALLDVDKRLAEVPNSGARYFSHRSHLYLRLAMDVIDEEHEYEHIRLAFATSRGMKALPLEIQPEDVSSFINVIFDEFALDVE